MIALAAHWLALGEQLGQLGSQDCGCTPIQDKSGGTLVAPGYTRRHGQSRVTH